MVSVGSVAVISRDEALAVRCQQELAGHYSVIPFLISDEELESPERLRKRLREVAQEVVGIDDGNIGFHAAVIDVFFHPRVGEKYFIAAPLFDELPADAASLLATLLGAGLHVLVNDHEGDFAAGWQIGVLGCKPLRLGQIHHQLLAEENCLRFLRATLEFENDFAPVYDRKELARAGTVSAIVGENKYVLEKVAARVTGSSSPAKVLDLGCGTGRFEELLLTDPETRRKIEQIVAIDFAPMYLVQAKKRLPHFVKSKDLEKVVFLRRIAEGLHWPSGYFDIVVASFGIVCFSKTHFTLQEAYRVLKPGGLLLLNGYNRDSITFDFDETLKGTTGERASHLCEFTIKLSREEDTLEIEGRYIKCFTFNVDGLQTLLKLIGFTSVPKSVQTFPTFYGSVKSEHLAKLSSRVPVVAGQEWAHSNCIAAGECRDFASYQGPNLKEDQFGSGFNETLHNIDHDLTMASPALINKGFYFCMAVHK